MIDIPEDIVNSILDNFPYDSHSTFISCSTVARSFLPPSQARLFRRVCISSYQDRCQRLHSLVTQSPHIAQYIRILVLESERLLGGAGTLPSPNSIFDDLALAPLLDKLPNLNALQLCPQHTETILDWRTFSPDLQAAFLQQFMSQRLTHVELGRLNVPADVLSSLKHVTQLRLPDSNIVGVGPTPNNLDFNLQPSPKSLMITAAPSAEVLLNDLKTVVDLRHLHELVIVGFEQPTFDAVGSLMKECAPTLQRLQWTYPVLPYDPKDEYNDNTDPTPINLWIPPTLRSLEVGERQEANSGEYQSPVCWAQRALEDLVRQGNPVDLEDVTIGIIHEFFGCMGMEYLKMWQVWDTIDALLANEVVFPHLTGVTVMLCGGWDEEDLEEQFLSDPRVMPRVRSRGILDLSKRRHFTDQMNRHD